MRNTANVTFAVSRCGAMMPARGDFSLTGVHAEKEEKVTTYGNI
jgi:hypothetical protein